MILEPGKWITFRQHSTVKEQCMINEENFPRKYVMFLGVQKVVTHYFYFQNNKKGNKGWREVWVRKQRLATTELNKEKISWEIIFT